MYILPQPHECPKCGFVCKYGPDDLFPAPVFDEGPLCPKCYGEFLRANCGVMTLQVVKKTDGVGVLIDRATTCLG